MKQEFDRNAERTELLSALSEVPSSHRKQLIDEYRKRSEAAFAPSTLRNYRMILRLFEEWCDQNHFNAEPPIAPQTVAAWVDDMGGKLAATTIETRLWGIAELHRSRFLPSPTRNRLVASRAASAITWAQVRSAACSSDVRGIFERVITRAFGQTLPAAVAAVVAKGQAEWLG
jgi:hypothetical protein